MSDYADLIPLLRPFGELRSQHASHWTGEQPLPEEVAKFYTEAGPWGETVHESVGPVGVMLTVGGNPVCIPPLSELANLQYGYAWVDRPQVPLDMWNPDWLVIAEHGGDPFIFDRSSGQVLFDQHGGGRWDPRVFAPNLFMAIGSLATVAHAFVSLDQAEHFEDFDLKPSGRRIITDALAHFLGDSAEAERVLAVWAYYQ